MSQQLQSDLGVAGTSDPLQHRPPLPQLDILAFDADEEPPEEWEAEDDVKGGPLDPAPWRLWVWRLLERTSVAARFNFLAVDRSDLLYSVKELMRNMASSCTQDLTSFKRVARYTIKYHQLDSNIEVFGHENFAGCHSTRKSTVGGVAMWSGQFVKAWS